MGGQLQAEVHRPGVPCLLVVCIDEKVPRTTAGVAEAREAGSLLGALRDPQEV
jgi:hypothetical protein